MLNVVLANGFAPQICHNVVNPITNHPQYHHKWAFEKNISKWQVYCWITSPSYLDPCVIQLIQYRLRTIHW